MWLENQDDEQNKNTQSSSNGLNVGAGGSTASAPPSGVVSNPSTQAPVQSNQPKQDFANVQDYLKGNQTQREDLGQQFTNKLDQSATGEKNTIANAAAGATQDINAGTTAYNPDIVAKAAANPTAVAGDPQQLDSFLKQWNASYQGPSSFEASNEYGTAAGAANEANQNSEQLKTTGGQQQILQDQFGVYGQGNKGLDQTLLQTSSYFPKVQQQQKDFAGIQDYLQQNANTVNPLAATAKTTAEQARQNAQDAFSNSLTGFQNDLNNRTTNAQNTAQTNLNKYQSDLKNGDAAAVSADLKEAGVDAPTAKNITDYLGSLNKNYGINPNIPSSYIGNPNVDINNATVATPEDYAKAAALQKLTGVNYSGVLNPAEATKAGTGTLPQNAFKSGDLQSYLKDQLTTQDKSLLQKPVPPLGSAVKNLGDTKEVGNFVQNYIDALTRQGTSLENNPTLKNLHDQLQYNIVDKYRNVPGQENTVNAANSAIQQINLAQAKQRTGK